MKKPVDSENAKNLTIGIVMDTSLDPPDGVQQYVIAVGSWLRCQGHQVHYLVGETKRTDIANVHSLSRNITVNFNGNKMTIPLWANRRVVKKLLREQHFDVLHVQTPHHPLMAQYIINSAHEDTAVVATFHILPYNAFARIATRLLGFLLRTSLKRVDTMMAVSSSAANFASQSFGLPAKVSPNVFDYERFSAAQPLPQYNDDVLTILFLGRLVERKGCQFLLAAIANLDRTNLPPFRVVICGKGGLLPRLEQFVKDNDLTSIVEFAGFVSEVDKPNYYASADVCIFPSTSGESFGIVLLEAMASGSSVVYAGNNPGYATVMETQPEQLFDPKNIEELQRLIITSLTDKNLRNNRAIRGKTYVKSFDVEGVGPELVQIYQKAIAKRTVKQHNDV